jgi:hypothetical protein
VISLEIRRRRASMPPVWSLCLLPYLAIPSAIGDCYISFFSLFFSRFRNLNSPA